MKKRLIGILTLIFASITFNITTISAQNSARPMILPVTGAPGASTWIFGQAYGNTTGAYNFGDAWYSAGQGLHFGIDIAMPCGTPLVAVADGEVAFVDNLSFGSAPHNLILRHPTLGLTTLYGHLLGPAPVTQGQFVTQGQLVGYSGDPDSTCVSRPHLHLEVRSLDYRTTYNPFDYIDANWHSLASTVAFGTPLFQGDMMNARRWMTLEDQPDVSFGGARLNRYASVWPLPSDLRPPENPPMPINLEPLPENVTWGTRQIGFDGCCWIHEFDPIDPDTITVVDGVNGQPASVFTWSASTGTMTNVLFAAPPPVTSPDGTHFIYNNGGTSRIVNTLDGTEYTVNTQGATPALSTDNQQLVWMVRGGSSVPGAAAPNSAVWISDISGENARIIVDQPGASARWLDATRLLISVPQVGRITTLYVHDTRDGTTIELGSWRNVRQLSVSPGGNYLMFMLMWQGENNTGAPNIDGTYVLSTSEGATPQRLEWFGGWRWRDAESVYYLPLNAGSPFHSLGYYNIVSGENRILTTPDTLAFTIMNGDWDVSADGTRIVFQNAVDRNMWLLEIEENGT